MIRLELAEEPDNFDQDVRKPGNAHLAEMQAEGKKLATEDFKPLWRSVATDLRKAYGGCCAYSCVPIYGDNMTVDHYKPKKKYPHLAYEWSNMLPCAFITNSYKGDHEDVISPFDLPAGAFHLNLVTGAMSVNRQAFISQESAQLAQSTIDRLHLNSPGLCETRAQWCQDFMSGSLNARKHAPFVYDEMERQGML